MIDSRCYRSSGGLAVMFEDKQPPCLLTNGEIRSATIMEVAVTNHNVVTQAQNC